MPGVPVVPALVNGAAGIAATIGTLGAATGGVGVMAAAAAAGIGGGVLVARNRPAAAQMLRRTVTQTRTQTQRAGQARSVARRAAATRRAGVRAASPGAPRRKAKNAGRVAASRARSQGVMTKRTAAGAKRAAAVKAAAGRRAEAGQRKAQARVAKAAQRTTAPHAVKRPATGGRSSGGFPKLRAGRSGGGVAGRRSPMARAQRKNARAAAVRNRVGRLAATGRAKAAARRTRLGQRATRRTNDRDARRSHLRARKAANRTYRRRSFAAKLTTFGRRRLERLAALRDQYMATLDEIDATYGQGVSLVTPLSEQNRATPFGFIQTVPYIHGGATMSDSFNFVSITEDLVHAAQSGDMDGALSLLQLAEQMPTVFANIANAFAVVASRTNDEMPIGPETRAAFEEVGGAVQRIVDAAEQVAPTMRREHEHDIERLENPRTNEGAWDVVANQ